jgi:preprotein translocase SecE subunit
MRDAGDEHMFEGAMRFMKEVKLETTKVTWPSLIELREATLVVIVAVAIIAVFIAVVDRVLAQVVTLLI